MQADLDIFRAIITRHYPELSGSPMELLDAGFDSAAVAVDGWIFKFPREDNAGRALVREHAILQRVRPRVMLRVPELTLHPGPPVFSRHEMIPGEHLTAETYGVLPADRRQALGEALGWFYAEMHAIPPAVFEDVPAASFHPEPSPETVAQELRPVLPDDLLAFANETLAAWRDLGADPHGDVFSYFDGHGWNMAFDHERGVLNGVYDFADARVAPLQTEFIYSNFVSRDLTSRIISVYERLTGRVIDRKRVDLLFSILLVKEISGWEGYPERLPQILGLARAWVGSR